MIYSLRTTKKKKHIYEVYKSFLVKLARVKAKKKNKIKFVREKEKKENRVKKKWNVVLSCFMPAIIFSFESDVYVL